MFTGRFNEVLAEPNNFDGELRKGILCDKNCIKYSSQNIEIAYWGILYNKKALGVSAIANDAEAVATIFKQNGTNAFEKLDGSFTFILRTNNQTIIVRDHHGTNLQVYYNDRYFASSLALLKQTPQCSTTPNYKALGSFLSIGYIATPNSSFLNINKLAAGSILICSNDGQQHVKQIFETSSIEPSEKEVDLENISTEYGSLHSEAIKRRIGSSRNVGILLSGGYDSGCNLAALRKIYNGDIHSYSIGFKGDNWTELPLAQCMSDTFSTIHETYEIDGSEIEFLPEIVRELGDPFVEGGLMVNYAAMKMIGTNKPDVILGGDGSDQYFGTSGREVAIHYLASKYGVKPVLSAFEKALSCNAFEKNNQLYRVRFHLDKIINILQGDLFGFPSFMLKDILKDSSQLPKFEEIKSDTRSFEHLYTQHTYRSDLEKIINQVILFKASRMAAMFENTIAFPYMDMELYRFLMDLPVGFKCKGDNAKEIARGRVTAKFLLKYHYKPMLPEAITTKKKQGGFAPMPLFFKDKARRDRIGNFVMDSSITNEFLNRDAVHKFIKTYDSEADQTGNWFWYKQNKAIQYFNLLNLAIWWEQYVKGNNLIGIL